MKNLSESEIIMWNFFSDTLKLKVFEHYFISKDFSLSLETVFKESFQHSELHIIEDMNRKLLLLGVDYLDLIGYDEHMNETDEVLDTIETVSIYAHSKKPIKQYLNHLFQSGKVFNTDIKTHKDKDTNLFHCEIEIVNHDETELPDYELCLN